MPLEKDDEDTAKAREQCANYLEGQGKTGVKPEELAATLMQAAANLSKSKGTGRRPSVIEPGKQSTAQEDIETIKTKIKKELGLKEDVELLKPVEDFFKSVINRVINEGVTDIKDVQGIIRVTQSRMLATLLSSKSAKADQQDFMHEMLKGGKKIKDINPLGGVQEAAEKDSKKTNPPSLKA